MSQEFETTIDVEGFEICVLVEADGYIYTEPDYGADADGNRGVKMDFLEDFKIEKVWDGSNKDITDKLKERHPHVWQSLEKEIEEKFFEAQYD